MMHIQTPTRHEGFSTDVTHPDVLWLSRGFADYGCRLNALAPEELFARYERARFLYPAKRERLEPIWDEVLDTWHRLSRAGALVSWVIDRQDEPGGGWASVMSWRSTTAGWVSQHLVSTGGPTLSRAVLLSACAFAITWGHSMSHQNWFRRDNPFAAAVFATFADRVGPSHARCVEHTLLELRVDQPLVSGPSVPAVRVVGSGPGSESTELMAGVAALVRGVRGHVFVVAEQLEGNDPALREVDGLYGLVGLRRHRGIYAALVADRVAGVALCYRGPIGINLSQLENRCDLVLQPGLTPRAAEAVVRGLLDAAQEQYRDLPGGRIPVVIDPTLSGAAQRCGAHEIRRYTQCVWLSEALPAWGTHVADIYARRLARQRGA